MKEPFTHLVSDTTEPVGYDDSTYPKLPDALNRSRILTKEDVASMRSYFSLGRSIKEIAEHFEIKYHTAYYHLQDEEKRRARTQRSSINSKIREQRDPDFKEKRKKQMNESTYYRRRVNPRYVKYQNKLKRDSYARGKQS